MTAFPPTDPRSDERLLTGTADQFGEFYERYTTTLIRFFWTRTRDLEVSADLAAETFAIMLDTRDRFDSTRGNPRQWMFGIANNLLKQFWRRGASYKRARSKLTILTQPTIADGWHEYERADALLDSDRLEIALSKLPKRHMQAVRLRIVEELSYDQIAIQLGCTRNNAKVRVLRGLRRMRSEFDFGEGEQ